MAWRSRALRTLAIIVPLLFLAACNSDKQEAIPTKTTKTWPPVVTFTTTPTGPPTTAPPVTQPLDASAYEADPCTSLTDTQKQTFGIDRAEPVNIDIDGKECYFSRGADDQRRIWVVFRSNTTIGLSGKYAENAAGAWDYWQPTEVNGYPAVAFDNDAESGHCSFAVGVSDQLYYVVSDEAIPGEERCATARNVATTILENIRTTG
jgi:hypothetical protein